MLHLLDDARGSLGNQLHHVRTQLTRSRIDYLKFLFYADGETVGHAVVLCLA
jgi:hypothetical protein